jgi:ribonucleoside-diphosphate reductase alpha chain
MDTVTSYFNGDSMASDVWQSKYQMKDSQGNPMELLPSDMHYRMANEFARIEFGYIERESRISQAEAQYLSKLGKQLLSKRVHQTKEQIVDELFSYFDKFKQIVPQGSVMSNLGNTYVFGSLSNCFGIAPPADSYAGICRADQELVQLMKRRGGVGTHLSNLRFDGAGTTNAAKSSTGVPSFAERYSNSTREVAQKGRRGALMLLLHVQHPDIFKFVKMKADRTKVTGANVSVIFNDEFMQLIKNGATEFICKFPIDSFIDEHLYPSVYNEIVEVRKGVYAMKINPQELYKEFVHQAWDNAEPGAAFIDRIVNYSPDGVYEAYIPELCNPCGEQWFHAYDTCRLMVVNYLGVVRNPFTAEAEVDWELLYELAYMQQRLGDALVDLEAEYIDKILNKLYKEYDFEDSDDYRFELQTEIRLWEKIKKLAIEGRRTGNGFTALADTLAALGLKYDSDEALAMTEQISKKKMEAELDAMIDMAITRGTFTGWEAEKEFIINLDGEVTGGRNDFYQMILEEFPEQAALMVKYGRRNVSWSTVAPTGSVSIMTQSTSGIEPAFKVFYIRRRKINPDSGDVRVDFIDQNGDQWQEYGVLHPQFKNWIENTTIFKAATQRETVQEQLFESVAVAVKTKSKIKVAEDLPKELIEKFFEHSPWYGSEADSISWEKRIDIQAIVQKYTSNAISATINLPKDIKEEVVHGIYLRAWEKGLKGVTVYRDGSRTGVLVTETATKKDEFGYIDAVPRPNELSADYQVVTVAGKSYAVIIGKMNELPYELFVLPNPSPIAPRQDKGKVIKVSSGDYKYQSSTMDITHLQENSNSDERLLTRWASQMLRYGVNPKHIANQVEKSEVLVTSFPKAISRVLKSYIADEVIAEKCDNCNESGYMVYEEGCKKCKNCGHSKC